MQNMDQVELYILYIYIYIGYIYVCVYYIYIYITHNHWKNKKTKHNFSLYIYLKSKINNVEPFPFQTTFVAIQWYVLECTMRSLSTPTRFTVKRDVDVQPICKWRWRDPAVVHGIGLMQTKQNLMLRAVWCLLLCMGYLPLVNIVL